MFNGTCLWVLCQPLNCCRIQCVHPCYENILKDQKDYVRLILCKMKTRHTHIHTLYISGFSTYPIAQANVLNSGQNSFIVSRNLSLIYVYWWDFGPPQLNTLTTKYLYAHYSTDVLRLAICIHHLEYRGRVLSNKFSVGFRGLTNKNGVPKKMSPHQKKTQKLCMYLQTKLNPTSKQWQAAERLLPLNGNVAYFEDFNHRMQLHTSLQIL